MPVHTNYFEQPFDLKLEQLDGQDKGTHSKVIGSVFITFNTLQKICRKERLLVWSLPLAAFQRKIDRSGRFALPDGSIIDDVFEFILNDYREYQNASSNSEQQSFPSVMVINWLKQKEPPKGVSGATGSETLELDSGGYISGKSTAGPMKEKDWDYVFQANKILSCSYVDPSTSQVLRASHSAFRLRRSDEDDAEPDLPQDDDRAKIPVWTLSKEPSRTYIHETHSELETSAMISGHSRESLEVGLSGAFKALSAEGKYGRTTERAYKDIRAYGKKESTMLIFYEIPIVELSLDKGNSRISDACRRALLKLRDERSFDDLMEFFAKYGTMYSKKVVLGGRLISNQRFFEETMAETNIRQKNAKNDASLSVGIDALSVKNSYADEHGTETEHSKKDKTDQKAIDWMAIGGNAGYASKVWLDTMNLTANEDNTSPEKWLPTVSDYKYWKVVQVFPPKPLLRDVENAEVLSIQDFIGTLSGYDDVPGLFQEILEGGLYSPESLYLGSRPALPGQREPMDDGLSVAPLGVGIDTLTLSPPILKQTLSLQNTLQFASSRIKARRGCSWQVLDTADAVKLEISSTLNSLTNTGANRSAIPEHLYRLSLEPQTISVVLRWKSDLIEKGLNLGSPNVAQIVRTYTTLSQLAPHQCSTVLRAAGNLKWEETSKKVKGKVEFYDSLAYLAKSTQYSSLAAFRVASWRVYLQKRLNAMEDKDLKAGSEAKQPETEQERYLDFIKTAIISMPKEDIGQQSMTMAPFVVTTEALKVLKDHEIDYKERFIAKLGHRFLQSYTEMASMDAVWRLRLPNGTQQDFYALRMTLQKYFLVPRTVSEVCGFMSAPEYSFRDIRSVPDVKVSIFGYRDELTKQPVDLINKPPSLACRYLTQDSLSRNMNRVAITMHPWKGLSVKDSGTSAITVNGVPPVVPEEFFVLNTRKAERLLLLLKLYSNDPNSGVKLENLPHFGKTLDKVVDPNSLKKDTGTMLPEKKQMLIQLVRDLEKTIPTFDPESTPL